MAASPAVKHIATAVKKWVDTVNYPIANNGDYVQDNGLSH